MAKDEAEQHQIAVDIDLDIPESEYLSLINTTGIEYQMDIVEDNERIIPTVSL